MSGTIQIERGIPMPHDNVRRYPWHTMQVADSFLFPASLAPTDAYKRVSQANERYAPKRFMVRKIDGELRCWRKA